MFVIEHAGTPVGECWLQRMNARRILDEFPGQEVRRIDLAIGVPHLWGKGLGSEAIRLLVRLAFERERADLLVCFCGGHNPRSRRAFEKAGLSVLRTVPRPGNPKADFGYDLILTRSQYERAHQAKADASPSPADTSEPARAAHPRLASWWTDDPADPGRLPLEHPAVQRLCHAIAPGAQPQDLGGVMSLNVRLDPPASASAGAQPLVLRVQQPDVCVSRPRLLALQEVRRRLAARGLTVPVALPWNGATVFRCGNRWAELEAFIPNERPAPSIESSLWLYRAMGTLHRALATLDRLDVPVPRPVFATFATPGSLRHWLPATEAAVRHDAEAAGIARLVRDLAGRLRRRWIPAAQLPVHLVHGDVRLSNVRYPAGSSSQAAPNPDPIYFDFGFMATRPLVHELAYSLAFTVWAFDLLSTPERFPWHCVPQLIQAYEAAAGTQLTPAEHHALLPYTAAVPLYNAALDGFTEDPPAKLRTRIPFLHLSEWLLTQSAEPWR